MQCSYYWLNRLRGLDSPVCLRFFQMFGLSNELIEALSPEILNFSYLTATFRLECPKQL